jgi:hypothetical protein
MSLLDERDPEVAALLLFLAGRADGGGDLGVGGREPYDQRIERGAVVGGVTVFKQILCTLRKSDRFLMRYFLSHNQTGSGAIDLTALLVSWR